MVQYSPALHEAQIKPYQFTEKHFNIQIISSPSPDHEVRPVNDLLRPHDSIRPVVSLMVIQVRSCSGCLMSSVLLT